MGMSRAWSAARFGLGGGGGPCPRPSNPESSTRGTVNGGVWKTTNATATSPTWVPRTIVCRRWPSATSSSAPRTLRTAPCTLRPGATATASTAGRRRALPHDRQGRRLEPAGERGLWQPADQQRRAHRTGRRPGRVAWARDLGGSATGTGGVYRSRDGGVTWGFISRPAAPPGPVSFLTGDPSNPNRFYATIQEPTRRAPIGATTGA